MSNTINELQDKVSLLKTENARLQEVRGSSLCQYRDLNQNCAQVLGLHDAGPMGWDDCRNFCCSVSSCSFWQWKNWKCWWGDQDCVNADIFFSANGFFSGRVVQHGKVTR